MTIHPHILIVEGMNLTIDEIHPLIHYQRTDGSSVPFFSHFILAPLQSAERRPFTGLFAGLNKISKTSWKEWADEIYAKDRWIDSFQQAAEQSQHQRLTLWITLPYASPHLMKDQERITLLTDWIQMVVKKWLYRVKSTKLYLQGFVWGREAISMMDWDVVRSCNNVIHHFNLQSFWLPNYRAANVANWGELGFDQIALFSNYTGSSGYGIEWLYHTCKYTALNKMGMQIVNGRGKRFGDQHVSEYIHCRRSYSNYQGEGPYVYRYIHHSLYELYLQRSEQYDQIYRFIYEGASPSS